MVKSILTTPLLSRYRRPVGRFVRDLFDLHAVRSYSQEGEDLILARLLSNRTNGYYVDVGAHHPKRFSNTFLFYKKGWKGINIDAMPGSMSAFKRLRPRDVNIEAAVGSSTSELMYHIFDEPALNTLDSDLAKKYMQGGERLVRRIPVPTHQLKDILDKYVAPDQKIDFLSVDVEGLDLEVLKTNNWTKYRPTLIVTEIFATNLREAMTHPTSSFLETCGYQIEAKSANSVIFRVTNA
jgi:FkbM family methyltransferase